jgi:hypothetical protein
LIRASQILTTLQKHSDEAISRRAVGESLSGFPIPQMNV